MFVETTVWLIGLQDHPVRTVELDSAVRQRGRRRPRKRGYDMEACPDRARPN